MKKITIFICSHKKVELPQHEYFLPVQAGAALHKKIKGYQPDDGNVILTEGLVLQDASIWKQFIKKDLIPENNTTELYFEEPDIEAFARKLEEYKEPIQYVNELMEHTWGQKVIRFYDPDGNLIEVGTPT